jgi:hypothetical protein
VHNVLRAKKWTKPTTPAAPGEVRPTILYTHRANVAEYNKHELEKLPGKLWSFESFDCIFESASEADRASIQSSLDDMRVANKIELRLGAQVMLLANLSPPFLVNGSRGVVTGFTRPDVKAQGTPVWNPKTKAYEIRSFFVFFVLWPFVASRALMMGRY